MITHDGAPDHPAGPAPRADHDHNHASNPDHDVLRLVQRGDRRCALQLLMRRHGDDVYRYCRAALRDIHLADDVRQQVFLEAYRDLTQFSGRSSMRTWLLSIARHRILDAMKARRRAHARVSDAALEEVTDAPDPRPSAAESFDEMRLRHALVASLEGLSTDVRNAVLLRFQQGMSYEDMAEVCGESPATLHARVTRALPLLRKSIKSHIEQHSPGQRQSSALTSRPRPETRQLATGDPTGTELSRRQCRMR
jgi:RNA polymerase sigma-70 factor (ECF subfamily)